MSDLIHLIHPVVLCGGGGTRLWPRSRPERPKPFLPLLGDRTLFQQALDRVADPATFAAPTIVAGHAHIPLVREQAPFDTKTDLIAEPMGRNTAPAIALAAHRVAPEAVMLVCPSDHFIADTEAFLAAVTGAAALAREGYLVSLGIEPDRPETGYGYIRQGASLAPGYKVDRFVEKPDRATAEAFIDNGGYFWNGGIFIFAAGTYLAELARFRPHMAEAVARSVDAGSVMEGVFHPGKAEFEAVEGDSIDYAVMERTERAAMVPVSMGWSDIGNWQALAEARQGRSNGVVDILGASNVHVDSDGPRVSVVGLDDIIVVVDGDDVLVTSREGAQQVGKLPGARGE